MKMTPMYVLFVDFMLMSLLYVTNNLNDALFYMLIFVAIMCLLWWRNTPRMITFEEARNLVYNTSLNLQRDHQLPDGTLRLMPETELKRVLLQDSEQEAIEPDNWEVGVSIDGNKLYGFVFTVSVFGEMRGCSEIDLPSSYSVRKTSSVKVFKAKKIAKSRDMQEKARKQVEEAQEDE